MRRIACILCLIVLLITACAGEPPTGDDKTRSNAEESGDGSAAGGLLNILFGGDEDEGASVEPESNKTGEEDLIDGVRTEQATEEAGSQEGDDTSTSTETDDQSTTEDSTGETAPEKNTEVNQTPLRIAYVQGDIGNRDIWVAKADGSEAHAVVADPDCDEAEPTWSPDGTELIFQRKCGEAEAELYRVDVDGEGTPETVKREAGMDLYEPDWSPDGTLLVYRQTSPNQGSSDNGELMIMTLEDQISTGLLASNGVSVIQGRAPVWSPDGKKILYMQKMAPPDNPNAKLSWQIFIYDYAGEDAGVKGNIGYSECANHCRWPDWSPDGSQIVFHESFGVDTLETKAVYIHSADMEGWSVEQLQLVDEGAHPSMPAWSSSTRLIAYNTDFGIMVWKPDNSKEIIIEGPENWAPVWSR